MSLAIPPLRSADHRLNKHQTAAAVLPAGRLQALQGAAARGPRLTLPSLGHHLLSKRRTAVDPIPTRRLQIRRTTAGRLPYAAGHHPLNSRTILSVVLAERLQIRGHVTGTHLVDPPLAVPLLAALPLVTLQ